MKKRWEFLLSKLRCNTIPSLYQNNNSHKKYLKKKQTKKAHHPNQHKMCACWAHLHMDKRQCRWADSPVLTFLTLRCLRAYKGLDEGVCSLGVQGQGVAEGLQLCALIQEGLLQAAAVSVEILLDGVQGHVQHCTLLGTQVLLRFFRHVLKRSI